MVWYIWYGAALTITTAAVTFMSCYQLLTYHPRPEIVKFYLRIILMPCLYSLSGALSLLALKYAYFIGVVRYTYEAYCLYLYGLLLFAYAGGEGRSAQQLKDYATEQIDGGALTVCPTCCGSSAPSCTHQSSPLGLVRTWKVCLAQYIAIKTVIELVIAFWSFYSAVPPSPLSIFGVRVIAIVSLTVLMYALITLYLRLMAPRGHPFKSLAKLVVIKILVFICVGQEFMLHIAVSAGWIREWTSPGGGITLSADENGSRWLALFIVTEMFGFSIVYWLYFGVDDFFGVRGLMRADDDRDGVVAGLRLFNIFDNFVPDSEGDLSFAPGSTSAEAAAATKSKASSKTNTAVSGGGSSDSDAVDKPLLGGSNPTTPSRSDHV